MDFVVDNEETVRRLKGMLDGLKEVDLTKIVLVGDASNRDTVTTLQSTFPYGMEHWKIFTKTGITRGLRSKKIPALKAIPRSYRHTTHYVVDSVGQAKQEGILPFSLNNPKIEDWNDLFLFSFLTGCISQGFVQGKPNTINSPVLEYLVSALGYTPKPDKKSPHYSVYEETYLVLSSQLARVFASLGLPYQQGNKSHIEDLELPWYVQLMKGKYLKKDQSFDNASKIMSERFLRRFSYVLLSDSAENANMKSGVSVELFATKTKDCGEALTLEVAQILRTAFPGADIPERNLMTTRKSNRDVYTNRIYLCGDSFRCVADQLKEKGDNALVSYPPTPHLYQRIRQLASLKLLESKQ